MLNRPATILIVDDEQLLREGLAELFTTDGYGLCSQRRR